MRRAIEVARGNPDAPFGAVIVDGETGEVIAEGLNRGEENPVWHGEIGAIVDCAENRPGVDRGRLVLYGTAEPCPMCSTAILWSGIPRLVYETLIDPGFPPLDLRIGEKDARPSPRPRSPPAYSKRSATPSTRRWSAGRVILFPVDRYALGDGTGGS
jgi:hypothetical protein